MRYLIVCWWHWLKVEMIQNICYKLVQTTHVDGWFVEIYEKETKMIWNNSKRGSANGVNLLLTAVVNSLIFLSNESFSLKWYLEKLLRLIVSEKIFFFAKNLKTFLFQKVSFEQLLSWHFWKAERPVLEQILTLKFQA